MPEDAGHDQNVLRGEIKMSDCHDVFRDILMVLSAFPESIKDGGNANVDCPLCNGKNTLRVGVAESNGHKGAYCSSCGFNIME